MIQRHQFANPERRLGTAAFRLGDARRVSACAPRRPRPPNPTGLHFENRASRLHSRNTGGKGPAIGMLTSVVRVAAFRRRGSDSDFGGISAKLNRMPPRLRSREITGFIEPCLPRPVDRPPIGGDWLHEIKHDGFRIAPDALASVPLPSFKAWATGCRRRQRYFPFQAAKASAKADPGRRRCNRPALGYTNLRVNGRGRPKLLIDRGSSRCADFSGAGDRRADADGVLNANRRFCLVASAEAAPNCGHFGDAPPTTQRLNVLAPVFGASLPGRAWASILLCLRDHQGELCIRRPGQLEVERIRLSEFADVVFSRRRELRPGNCCMVRRYRRGLMNRSDVRVRQRY